MSLPTVSEIVVGGLTTGTSFTLTSWTPAANDLILVAVAIRDESKSVSVSGNGLTFESVADIDNTQGQNGLNVFRAQGASPSAGQITVTIGSGNTAPVSAEAVRIAGANTGGTNGSAACEVVTTDPGPAVDNDDMKVAVVSLSADSLVFGFGAHRTQTCNEISGQTDLVRNQTQDTGGAQTRVSGVYQPAASVGAYVAFADNSLSAAGDWCACGIAVKPAAGAAEALAGTAAGIATAVGALARARPLAGTIPGGSTAIGAVARVRGLVGAAAGAGSSSAALVAARALSGASTALSSAAAALERARGLSGSAAGQAAVTGAAGVLRGLAGTAACSAVVSGAVSRLRRLAGLAAGLASAIASLLVPAQASRVEYRLADEGAAFRTDDPALGGSTPDEAMSGHLASEAGSGKLSGVNLAYRLQDETP